MWQSGVGCFFSLLMTGAVGCHGGASLLGTDCGKSICIADNSTLKDGSGALFAPSELNLVAHRYSSPYTNDTSTSFEMLLKEPNPMSPDTPQGLLTITVENGTPTLDKDYQLEQGTGKFEDGGTAQISFVADAGKPSQTATLQFQRFGTDDGTEIHASFAMTCTDGQTVSGSFDGTLYGPGDRVPCTADTQDSCALYLPESTCVAFDPSTVLYYTGGKCGDKGVCEYTQMQYQCPTGQCTNGRCPIQSTPSF
jgi:hypothetical protein